MNTNEKNTLAEVGVAAGGTIATVAMAAIAPEVLAVAGFGLVLFAIAGALCSDGDANKSEDQGGDGSMAGVS